MQTKHIYASLLISLTAVAFGCDSEEEYELEALDEEVHLDEGPDDLSFDDAGAGAQTQAAREPVVRIKTGSNYCTAAAITDDLVLTSFQCLQNSDGYAEVVSALGSNASAVGSYSSYFITTPEIQASNLSDGARLIGFIKFAEGTFSSTYPLVNNASIQTVRDDKDVRIIEYRSNGQVETNDTIYRRSGSLSGQLMAAWISGHGAEDGAILLDPFNVVLGAKIGGSAVDGQARDLFGVHTEVTNNQIRDMLDNGLSERCAEGYQHGQYGGWSRSFCDVEAIDDELENPGFLTNYSITEQANFSHWNDQLSSLRLADDMIATVSQSLSGGIQRTYQNVAPFLSNGAGVDRFGPQGINDMISKIEVTSSTSLSDEVWNIQIARTGKCLDLDSGNTNDGANIQQWVCQDQPNQRFNLIEAGSYYAIRHAASGKCVTVSNGNSNGTNIVLESCNVVDTDQLYALTPNATTADIGDFNIINTPESGKCIDLDSGSTSNGANIHLWSCFNGNANQNFRLLRK